MDAQATSKKPQAVSTATNLLWATLAIGLIAIAMDYQNFGADASAAFTNTVIVLTFSFLGFLIFKIAGGKNWARITFLIMFLIGLPFVLSGLSLSVIGALSVAQTSMQIYALHLLFSRPGSGWFKKVPLREF